MNLPSLLSIFRIGIAFLLCQVMATVHAADVTVTEVKPSAASEINAPLLKYQEAAAATELKRVTDWMLMPATSTDQLLLDGKALTGILNKTQSINITQFQPGKNTAYDLSSKALQRALPVEGETYSDALKSKANLYQNYVQYFASDNRGDPTKLGALNIANVLQTDVIPESNVPRDLLNLLVDPYPEKISVVPNRNSTVVDKENFAQKLTGQGLMSVPMNALSEMLARRIPSTGGENPKSVMQLLRSQAESRIKDATWSSSIAVLSQEALLREIAYMQAVQLYMQYQQYRLNEQAVSLLAVTASAQAKFGPMIADLAKQMNQAKLQR